MSDEERVGGMSSPGPPEEEPQSKERDADEGPHLETVRRELEERLNSLRPQLQRLNHSCKVRSARLKAKCEKVTRALGRLEELEGKIPGLAGEGLSEASKTLEQAQLCYIGVVSDPARAKWHWCAMFLAPALFGAIFGLLLCYGWATSCWSGWLDRIAGRVADPDPAVVAARVATFCTVFYCVCAGGLGGAAAALKDFSYFRGKRILDPAWMYSYLWRPVLGVIMGVVAWALLRGGMLLVSDAGTDVSVSNAVYFSVAFLAGFAVEQMVRKLYDIADTVFAVSDRTRRGG